MNLIKPISLVGIMGAGKTSFGKKIARKLDLPFFDLDNEIKIKSGYSTKEIYTYFGEKVLKKTEFSIVKETLNTPQAIISTGDGIADNKPAWEYLKQHSTIIWLNLDLKLIAQRLKPNDDRPYLLNDQEDILDLVTKLYRKRIKQYKQAHIRIYETNLSTKKFLAKLDKFQKKEQNQDKTDEYDEPQHNEKHDEKHDEKHNKEHNQKQHINSHISSYETQTDDKGLKEKLAKIWKTH